MISKAVINNKNKNKIEKIVGYRNEKIMNNLRD